jgi:hypothetical protein
MLAVLEFIHDFRLAGQLLFLILMTQFGVGVSTEFESELHWLSARQAMSSRVTSTCTEMTTRQYLPATMVADITGLKFRSRAIVECIRLSTWMSGAAQRNRAADGLLTIKEAYERPPISRLFCKSCVVPDEVDTRARS